MAPRHKNSDSGDSDLPKRSCKALPLSEEVNTPDFRGKKSMCCSSIYEIAKKEQEIHAGLPVASQNCKNWSHSA